MNETSAPRLSLAQVEARCRQALENAGAAAGHAEAVARATVTAEAEGNRAVGLLHLLDYLDGLEAGRIVGDAEPQLEAVTPIVTRIDARGGMQHLGFDRAFDGWVSAAREYGLAAVVGHNGFTVGSLAYYPRRLAEAGLAGMAFANAAPAIMPASGGSRARFCTNPMAFAVPAGADAPPVVIDQSSSASALVAIRGAAERGERIPEGWALGPDGEATTDPLAALAGVLLPFGGARGANVALLVELMAAGLTGADWSWESAPFNAGDRPPGVGCFVLAIDPEKTAGPGYRDEIGRLVEVLQDDGAFVPGIGKAHAAAAAAAAREGIAPDPGVWSRIEACADAASD